MSPKWFCKLFTRIALSFADCSDRVFIELVLPKAGREKWSSLVFSLDSTASILTRMRIARGVLNEHEWARTRFWFSCKRSFVGSIPLRCLLKLARREECFEQTHCLSSIYTLGYYDRGDGLFFSLHQWNCGHFWVICLLRRSSQDELGGIWTCSAPLEKECVFSSEAEERSLAARAHSGWILSSRKNNNNQKTKPFLAHRELFSSLKWMWFEWDPESLTQRKAHMAVTWDCSKLVMSSLGAAVNRRPSWQVAGALTPCREKAGNGKCADGNSPSWEPAWAQWSAARWCAWSNCWANGLSLDES